LTTTWANIKSTEALLRSSTEALLRSAQDGKIARLQETRRQEKNGLQRPFFLACFALVDMLQ